MSVPFAAGPRSPSAPDARARSTAPAPGYDRSSEVPDRLGVEVGPLGVGEPGHVLVEPLPLGVLGQLRGLAASERRGRKHCALGRLRSSGHSPPYVGALPAGGLGAPTPVALDGPVGVRPERPDLPPPGELALDVGQVPLDHLRREPEDPLDLVPGEPELREPGPERADLLPLRLAWREPSAEGGREDEPAAVALDAHLGEQGRDGPGLRRGPLDDAARERPEHGGQPTDVPGPEPGGPSDLPGGDREGA